MTFASDGSGALFLPEMSVSLQHTDDLAGALGDPKRIRAALHDVRNRYMGFTPAISQPLKEAFGVADILRNTCGLLEAKTSAP